KAQPGGVVDTTRAGALDPDLRVVAGVAAAVGSDQRDRWIAERRELGFTDRLTTERGPNTELRGVFLVVMTVVHQCAQAVKALLGVLPMITAPAGLGDLPYQFERHIPDESRSGWRLLVFQEGLQDRALGPSGSRQQLPETVIPALGELKLAAALVGMAQ